MARRHANVCRGWLRMMQLPWHATGGVLLLGFVALSPRDPLESPRLSRHRGRCERAHESRTGSSTTQADLHTSHRRGGAQYGARGCHFKRRPMCALSGPMRAADMQAARVHLQLMAAPGQRACRQCYEGGDRDEGPGEADAHGAHLGSPQWACDRCAVFIFGPPALVRLDWARRESPPAVSLPWDPAITTRQW